MKTVTILVSAALLLTALGCEKQAAPETEAINEVADSSRWPGN